MAAENVQTFTDGNFDDNVLKSARAGAGGLLGGVVRAVQAAGPDGRRAGQPNTPGKVTVGKLNVDENPKSRSSSRSAASRRS